MREDVVCYLLRCSSIKGSAILNARGKEREPRLAAGGHSTETSCLHIMLAAGWSEDGELLVGVGVGVGGV